MYRKCVHCYFYANKFLVEPASVDLTKHATCNFKTFRIQHAILKLCFAKPWSVATFHISIIKKTAHILGTNHSRRQHVLLNILSESR